MGIIMMKLLGALGLFIVLIVSMVSQVYTYIETKKLNILSVYSLVYTNYTSIKLFRTL